MNKISVHGKNTQGIDRKGVEKDISARTIEIESSKEKRRNMQSSIIIAKTGSV